MAEEILDVGTMAINDHQRIDDPKKRVDHLESDVH